METKTKQVNFRTPALLYEKISSRALQQGKSISSYMNDLAVEDIEHAEGYVLASEKDMLLEILRKLNKIERRLDEISDQV